MDLGRPERFVNMLRIFKPRSPMSMGAWCLSVFGGLASAAAAFLVFDFRVGKCAGRSDCRRGRFNLVARGLDTATIEMRQLLELLARRAGHLGQDGG